MKSFDVTTYVPDEDDHFTSPIGAYPQASVAWIASDFAKNKKGKHRVAVDIGAHIGHMSFVFAQRFDQVHAFEPVNENAECFVMNMRQFENKGIRFLDKIVLHKQALSNNFDAVSITNPAKDNSGAWEVRPGPGVRARTLDSYDLKDVDLIKVDTQGCEIAVLEGAKETIKNNRPILMIEVVNNGEVDHQLDQYILDLGYQVFFGYGKQVIYFPEELQ